jgi:Leucine-rich repeat (LRR) protein
LEETQGSWPNLQELSLGDTKVTDKGIGIMENFMPQLQRLDLTGNEGITDKGIESLVKLPLERLYVSRTKVTDASMESVRKLRKLEELYCGNNAVTDQGVANLKGMPYLKVLALADSQLTDKGLATLGSLKKLEFLVLDRTKVTDAGMAYLKGLTGLQRLRLAGTSVTAEGEATLMKAIPGLSIEREEGKLY